MFGTKSLDRLRRSIYNSPFYVLLRKSGLDDLAREPYWRLQLFLADDTVERTVGSYTARYYIETPYEFSRLNDPTLHGEKNTLTEILNSLHPDDAFYDIGSNIGLHACLAGDIIDSGTIVAIEPHPKSVDRLRQNLKLNNINGIVREYAFAADYGTAVLELPEDQAGAIGSVETSAKKNENSLEIDLVPGDDVIGPDGLPTPDVLKIDVDGGEMDVLRGLENTLRNENCRLIFCEIHPSALQDYGSTEEEVLNMLEEIGYSITQKTVSHDSRENAYYIRAERKGMVDDK